MHKRGLIPDSKVSIKARKRSARSGNANNFIDETGQRFGRLTVIKSDGRYNNEATWECKCDCGTTIQGVRGISLRCKDTTSCGCWHKEQLKQINQSRTNPNKAKYQKLAQQKRNEGMSYGAIAKWFIDNNLESLKGGKWYPATIKWLLAEE